MSKPMLPAETTLGDLQSVIPWVWLHCERAVTNRDDNHFRSRLPRAVPLCRARIDSVLPQ